MDWFNPVYLKDGNTRQQNAFRSISACRVLELLKAYNPVITGTIPIGIELPESDIDIICEVSDFTAFEQLLIALFKKYSGFQLEKGLNRGVEVITAGFHCEGEFIEIYGQDMPVTAQNAFRHMLIEHEILQSKGLQFKNEVIQLKKEGLKTEPAFAQLLNLSGDPYAALLQYEV